ncbi:unnamed protein product [Heterobilharzia americana]|nr:unnamed protein product [Heterobilharzia americana]
MAYTHNVYKTISNYFATDSLKCITIVLASSVIVSINNGIMYIPGIYVPYWREEMNASRFQLDFIGSLQMGLAFCQGPFTEYLIHRHGYRITPALGGIICAVSFIICAFTVHISMLYIFYGVGCGLGIGMMYMSAVIAVTTNFNEKQPLAMGIVTCGTGIGLSGVFTIISTYFTKPWEYAIYSAVDGLCCGAYSVLQPLVLVEILSTDHVTKGLGVLLFVCGIGYLFGAPILALVYDHWKSYEFCYGICGSVCLIASFLVLIMWLVSFRKLRLEKAELQLKRNLEMSSHLYCRGESDCSSVSATELNYMV